MTKRALLALAGFAASYAVMTLPPMKDVIGRYSPVVASLLSPFLFNFSRTYETGRVLEFRIGMTKEALFETLKDNYSGRGELVIDCTVTTAESVVPITAALNISVMYGRGNRLCSRLDSHRLSMHVEFAGDRVSTIEVRHRWIELP